MKEYRRRCYFGRMGQFFNSNISTRAVDICMLILRLFSGGFMLTHGIPKLQKLTSSSEIKFADPFGFGPVFSLALAVFAEVICSVLLMLGLGTRIASLFLIITMGVAAFHAHAADPFATKEKALLYLLIFTAILIIGPGRFSVDRSIAKR